MQQDNMYEFSTLGRAVDPRYPSNLAALIMIAVGAVVLFGLALVNGMPLLSAALEALGGAVVIFVMWALGREFDPDSGVSAVVAGVLGFGCAALFGVSGLIPAFALIIMARVVNRTVGMAPKFIDTLGVLAMTGVAIFLADVPWFGLVGAFAFAVDAFLPGGNRAYLLAAGASAAATGLAFALSGAPFIVWPSVWELAAAAGAAALFVIAIATTRSLESVGDATKEPLNPLRVRLGMAVGLAALAAVVLSAPNVITVHYPIWATLATVGFVRLRVLFED